MNLFLIAALAYAFLQIIYSVYVNSDKADFLYIVAVVIIRYPLPFALFYLAGVNA